MDEMTFLDGSNQGCTPSPYIWLYDNHIYSTHNHPIRHLDALVDGMVTVQLAPYITVKIWLYSAVYGCIQSLIFSYHTKSPWTFIFILHFDLLFSSSFIFVYSFLIFYPSLILPSFFFLHSLFHSVMQQISCFLF